MRAFRVFPWFLLVVSILSACGGRTSQPVEPVNVEATVQAAVLATSTNQAEMQAAIDAAVQATATSQAVLAPVSTPTPMVITQVVTQTVTEVVTEEVYVPENVYVTMSEEELASLINEAVAQAMEAADAYASSASSATSDGSVSSEEVQTIEVYVDLTEEMIAYTEELLATYSAIYGDIGNELANSLATIETELAAIAATTEAMAVTLIEVEETLNAGLLLAEETIAELEQTAANVTVAVDDMRTQVETLAATIQTEVANRNPIMQELATQPTNDFAAIVQAVQPQHIADDQVGALQSVATYMEIVRNATSDNVINIPEMQAIAQAGSNATLALDDHAVPLATGLMPAINDVTNAVARGDLDQARQGIASIEFQMPGQGSASVPALPSIGDGGKRPGDNSPGSGGSNRRP